MPSVEVIISAISAASVSAVMLYHLVRTGILLHATDEVRVPGWTLSGYPGCSGRIWYVLLVSQLIVFPLAIIACFSYVIFKATSKKFVIGLAACVSVVIVTMFAWVMAEFVIGRQNHCHRGFTEHVAYTGLWLQLGVVFDYWTVLTLGGVIACTVVFVSLPVLLPRPKPAPGTSTGAPGPGSSSSGGGGGGDDDDDDGGGDKPLDGGDGSARPATYGATTGAAASVASSRDAYFRDRAAIGAGQRLGDG